MLKLNVGLSFPEQSFTSELRKIELTSKYDIDYLSVISLDTKRINKFWEAAYKTVQGSTILCSAPIYETVLLKETPEETIKRQTSYGVRAMTFHITPKALLNEAEKNGFVINSRGGQFIREIQGENPYYERLSELILYAYDHGVKKIFLGTALRPGSCGKISPYTIRELEIACELYDKYIFSTNLDYEIEAFGHVAVSEFPLYKYILGDRKICAMGPLLTDAVNGFDELNAIIGYTRALLAGFNITTECMISRKEHIEIPNVEDVEDELQKWRVAEFVHKLNTNDYYNNELNKKVCAKKSKQRDQCSAHYNIFGNMDNIPEICNVCGDKCPLKGRK